MVGISGGGVRPGDCLFGIGPAVTVRIKPLTLLLAPGTEDTAGANGCNKNDTQQ